MLDSTQILINRFANPHRYGSLDYRRWAVLRAVADSPNPLVGNFITEHNTHGPLASGGLGERWHAVRYLKYMRDRGFIDLPGEVFERRAPRLMSTTALTEDLGQFTFGVELECYLPNTHTHNSGARAVAEGGVDCVAELYGHQTRSHWKVVTDGSLGNYMRGAEFVSPVLQGDPGLQQVTKVCNALRGIRTRVSKRCGLHVHVGARGQSPQFFANLLKLYANNQRLIDQLVPPSRRGSANHFCREVRINALEDGMTLSQIVRLNSRFCKVNLEAYARHGTVEFRHAAGTIEADKVTYWVKLCLRLVAAAAAGITQQFDTLADLLTAIHATEEERTWLLNRAARLATNEQRRAA
jgi:Putative amidoligase enzyme